MNTEMESSTDTATAQLTLLHRVSGIVSSSLSLNQMLDELVGLVVSVTNCDSCLVYLFDKSTAEVVLCASQLPHSKEIGNIRMKVGEGLTGWVVKTNSIVALSSQASSDPRFKLFASLPEDTYEAFLSVPLISGGAVIGVINVHHRNPRQHSTEVVTLLSYIAEQMGGAIAKAQLLEQSQAAGKKVEVLAAVGETISSEGYLDRILQAISEMVAGTFDSPLCSIMIVDEDRQELVIKAVRSSSPEYMNRMPLRIEDSLIGRVVRERQVVVVDDVVAEQHYQYREIARKAGLSSLLSVPLCTGRGVIGTLNIYLGTRRAFTEEELRFAKAVAGQAALALENARLMAETLEMKQTLEARKIIERAKGILQHRDGLTEEEAYLHMRNESRRHRRSMRGLAEAIILVEEIRRKGSRPQVSAPLPPQELPSESLERSKAAFDANSRH